MADNRDIDHHSGVETTGHEWDGLKELNNPLPRWWVLVFWATIVWAIAYWVVFPSWPMLPGADRNADYTKGIWHVSERAQATAAVAADKAAQSKYVDKIGQLSVAQVNSDPELLKFSMMAGKAAFLNNCAGCHGSGAAGGPGFANLNDDNWLWGGTLDEIYQTIMYGVRNGSDQARGGGSTAGMPERASVLKPDQINDVAEYVLSLSKKSIRRGGCRTRQGHLCWRRRLHRLPRRRCQGQQGPRLGEPHRWYLPVGRHQGRHREDDHRRPRWRHARMGWQARTGNR